MLTVYDCIVTAHDLRLVGLAAVICALASFAAISLLHHVLRSTGHMRFTWLVVSATSTGFGIWATHFIAMLAFSPGLPSAYNITLTVLSLIAAIVLTGTGLAVAATANWAAGAWIGGVMVGGGIAAMHYTGMAAFEIQGRINWDPALVASSIALGGLIGAVALPVGLRDDRLKWKSLGALLLTVAICSHHFTAMGAVSVIPDPTAEFSPSAIPAGWLAIAVALASFAIILLALGGVAIEMQRVLQNYMRDLERSNQELDDFAYIASHDLKEPLRGLFNHATFLLEDYQDKLDEDGKRRLNRLAQLSQRMERLVNDLLHFSRLGRAGLASQETDTNAVIAEIRLMMEDFLRERCARIIVPGSLPRLVCDKAGVAEIFRNLITNAVKYNDKAERLVEIGFLTSVDTRAGLEHNVFYVRDNGIGIEPEFHDEIFRIFKRLQNAPDGQEPGTGVGLTFVKKIVERHGGRIWLRSKPDEGTIFYFNLNCKLLEPARKIHERDIVPVPVHSHS